MAKKKEKIKKQKSESTIGKDINQGVEPVFEQKQPMKERFTYKISKWFSRKKDDLFNDIAKGIEADRKEFYKANSYSPYKPKNFLDIGKVFNKMDVEKNKSKVFLIHMELSNGKHRQFTINSEFGSFLFDNKRYLLDEECKYEDIDSKMWCLDYHETMCLPIKRRIPSTDLIREAEMQSEKIYQMLLNHENENVRKAIAEIPKPDIIYAINPENLERFMISKVIEKVINGGAMEDIFGFIKIIMIVNAIIGGISLLLSIVLIFMVK